MYTEEQVQKRNKSIWTKLMSTLAPLQFIAFVISFYLVCRYLVTGDGYTVATASVLIKIALLWAMTIVGILWEKEMYGHYFMCKEFFWEDFGNLVALLTHNAYFVVQWLDFSRQSIMLVMCLAYTTYLFNFAQFMVKMMRSRQQRKLRKEQSWGNLIVMF